MTVPFTTTAGLTPMTVPIRKSEAESRVSLSFAVLMFLRDWIQPESALHERCEAVFELCIHLFEGNPLLADKPLPITRVIVGPPSGKGEAPASG